MAKAKTASKNNPAGRGKGREYFFEGKKVRLVKVIELDKEFMAVEYHDTGEFIKNDKNEILSWKEFKKISAI